MKQSKVHECLSNLAKALQINKPSDWGKVTNRHFIENNCAHVLKKYRYSIPFLLKEVYKDINWKDEWFRSKPIQKDWQNHQVQKNFLENFAKKYGIKKPSDWGKVTVRTLKREKGTSLLNMSNGSIYKLVSRVFPEIQWKKEWFQNLKSINWVKIENRQAYLKSFAIKFGIKNKEDWGKVLLKDFQENGGVGILLYGRTVQRILQNTFPDTEWKKEWFIHAKQNPRGHWKKKENLIQFLNELAKKYNILKHSDWGNISHQVFMKEKSWFSKITPPSHWEDVQNQKRFMDALAAKYNVAKSNDWRRVSAALIKKQGGHGLLSIYQNSIWRTLSAVYPQTNWISIFPLIEESQPQLEAKKFVGVIFG